MKNDESTFFSFFFSSRRRHTRSLRDWSSDVCSSDLFTYLAVDSIFMMPQLGVLSGVHEQAAAQVFERDCLIRLGAVLAPVGTARAGQACVTVELEAAGSAALTRRIPFGEVTLLPLPASGVA